MMRSSLRSLASILLSLHVLTDVSLLVQARRLVPISATSAVLSSFSPVKHLDSSLAASSAQGTMIAMCVPDTECIILFLRTATSNIWRPSKPFNPKQQTVFGFNGIVPIQDSSQVSYAPSWIVSPSDEWICAMTGFASDVEHLVRRLQLRESNNQSIYQQPISMAKLWNRLVRLLQSTAFRAGGRPFAIQTVMVGLNPAGDMAASTKESANYEKCIYTMDPSGNWNSWGQGTATGKYAYTIRKQLAKQINKAYAGNDDDTPSTDSSVEAISDKIQDEIEAPDLEESLKIVLRSWFETCKEESVSVGGSSVDDYQMLMVWRDPDSKQCRTGKLDDAVLQSLVQDMQDAVFPSKQH